jgi:gas vesicle protein
MAKRKRQGGEASSFIGGLILGFIFSAPIAAWLSPRSGGELRQSIVQRGLIMRRRVEKTIRKPLEQVQEQLKGDSVDEALREGKTIAARFQSRSNGKPSADKGGK